MKLFARLAGSALAVLIVATAAVALSSSCTRATSAVQTNSEELKWVTSLSEGLKQAAEQNKPLMVDFYTEWCGWCHELDKRTYSDERVQAKAEQFVCVKVNAEADRESSDRYRVEGFPTIVFLDAKGKEVHRVGGFLPPAEFLQEMDKALTASKPH